MPATLPSGTRPDDSWLTERLMPVLLALGSALVYGVGDYFGGRASRHQASVIVAALGQFALAIAALERALVLDPDKLMRRST